MKFFSNWRKIQKFLHNNQLVLQVNANGWKNPSVVTNLREAKSWVKRNSDLRIVSPEGILFSQ